MDINSAATKAQVIAGDAAYGLAGLLRHINLFRAAEFDLARSTGVGCAARRTAFPLLSMQSFDAHDQDVNRSAEQRKADLCRVNRFDAERLASFVEHLNQTKTGNAYAIHQLRQISDVTLGQKNSAESLRYIRRAALKLHPDKTKDLDGWSRPDTIYAKDLPPTYRYHHAKEGAAGLFALHQALAIVHRSPYYSRELTGPAAKHGGKLTIAQILRDTTLVGAALVAASAYRRTLLRPVLLGLLGAYGTLAAIFVGQAILSLLKQRRQTSCRDLIISPKGMLP